MSKRNYITIDEVNELLSSTISEVQFDAVIEKAESDIDSLIAPRITGVWSKAEKRQLRYSANFVSDTSANLVGSVVLEDNSQYLVCKILTGLHSGAVVPITGNNGNTITINELTGVSGAHEVIIYQFGRLPFEMDSDSKAKWINEEVKQAVAYQIEYLVGGDQSVARKGRKKKTEAFGTSGWSHTYEDSATILANKVDIAPKALALMGIYSATTID